MTEQKRQQAHYLIHRLNEIGKAENPFEYGLPINHDARMEQMVEAVLDVIDPRQSMVEEQGSEGAIVTKPQVS